ncbi:hypothetical protein [Streptomyces sp. NPDC047985]
MTWTMAHEPVGSPDASLLRRGYYGRATGFIRSAPGFSPVVKRI